MEQMAVVTSIVCTSLVLSIVLNAFLAVWLRRYYQGLCYARKILDLSELVRNADVEEVEKPRMHTKMRRVAAGKRRRK